VADGAHRHTLRLMTALRAFSHCIDAISEAVGLGLRWVALLLIALGVVNVFGRYLGAQIGFQLSSNALLEAQTQAFAVLFLLGASDLLRQDGHIRVDIVHSHLSARARAWIDLIGGLLVVIPFSLVMLVFGLDYVERSWSRLEVSPNPGGLPLYPIKTLILVGFTLLLLQGLSQVIKAASWLRGET